MRLRYTVIGIDRKLNEGSDITLRPNMTDPTSQALNNQFYEFDQGDRIVFKGVKDSIAAGLTLGSDFYFDISAVT